MEASEKFFPLVLFKLRHKYCSIIGLYCFKISFLK